MTTPVRLLVDEDVNAGIVSGLRRATSDIEIVTVHEVGLNRRHDTVLLEWADRNDHLILTHDESTMTDCAYDRVASGRRVPGICVVHQNTPISAAIDGVLLMVFASLEGEWENQVRYVPRSGF